MKSRNFYLERIDCFKKTFHPAVPFNYKLYVHTVLDKQLTLPTRCDEHAFYKLKFQEGRAFSNLYARCSSYILQNRIN
jgi:hypothetical protein